MIGSRKTDDNEITADSIYESALERTGSHAAAVRLLETIAQAEEEQKVKEDE